MPSSDYTTTGGGLKLKGAKDASIDKKRKKKKATPSSATPHPDKAAPLDTNKDVALRKALEDEDGDAPESRSGGAKSTQVGGTSTGDVLGHGKTEAERRHEERRRKRLDERLKREGVKTHKERVEELNKYLSNLSEHHDMPRIGPG